MDAWPSLLDALNQMVATAGPTGIPKAWMRPPVGVYKINIDALLSSISQ